MSQAFSPAVLLVETRVSQKHVQMKQASLKAAEPEAQTSLCALHGL